MDVSAEFNGIARITPIVRLESQRVNGEMQRNASVLSYIRWSPRFYSTAAVSLSSSPRFGPSLYARSRADVQLFWKPPFAHTTVLGAGFMTLQYANSRARVLSLTAVKYFEHCVIEGSAFVNRSEPGGLWSGSGLTSVQLGTRGRQTVRLRIAGGHQAYSTTLQPAIQLRANTVSYDATYRKWLAPKYGFQMMAGNQIQIGGTARRVDATAGLFFEF
jgi:YaiO family outer membrane protein